MIKEVSIREEIKEIRRLIENLLEGYISPTEFRTKTAKYSQKKVYTLFRDSFPKFETTIKNIVVRLFKSYFFSKDYEKNIFLIEYVDYKNFFPELKQFHDSVYFKGMNLKEIENYFLKQLVEKSTFTPLEKEFLKLLNEQIESKEPIIFNKIAKKLNVSNKKITIILNNLKKKGIRLKASIDWKKIGINEYFTLSEKEVGKSILIKKNYTLFPDLKILYIISLSEDKTADYRVVNKKYIINIPIILKNRNLSKQNKIMEQVILQKKEHLEDKSNYLKINSANHKEKKTNDYILSLLVNCAKDYKRPNFKVITENYEISERTLTRTKQKFVDQEIIKPEIRIKSKNHVKILLITKSQQSFLYPLLPSLEEYNVIDKLNNQSWFYILQIWREDVEDLLKILKKYSNCYLVINEETKYYPGKKMQIMQEKKVYNEFLTL
ncbi:MAG: hypothetical protein ACTSSL_00305 [Candidatus Heimdallarchaeaceae archaeon]